MFDIGMSELLLIGIVALIVVGPKDLPALFHTLGRPLPLDVVEEAHAVVGKLAIDRTLLRKYAADLDQKATSPTDRFAVRRIQSLADAAARAR